MSSSLLQHVAVFNRLFAAGCWLQYGTQLAWALCAMVIGRREWAWLNYYIPLVFAFFLFGKCQNPIIELFKQSHISTARKRLLSGHLTHPFWSFSAFTTLILTVTCHPIKISPTVLKPALVLDNHSTYNPFSRLPQNPPSSPPATSNWSSYHARGLIFLIFSDPIGVWKRYRIQIAAVIMSVNNDLRSSLAHEQTLLDDGMKSLHCVTNARDRTAIIDGRKRGTSVLLAFDEAWHKASGLEAEQVSHEMKDIASLHTRSSKL